MMASLELEGKLDKLQKSIEDLKTNHNSDVSKTISKLTEVERKMPKRYEVEVQRQAGLGSYVNNWDEWFAFKCPEGEVLTGLKSLHDDHYQLRRSKMGI